MFSRRGAQHLTIAGGTVEKYRWVCRPDVDSSADLKQGEVGGSTLEAFVGDLVNGTEYQCGVSSCGESSCPFTPDNTATGKLYRKS